MSESLQDKKSRLRSLVAARGTSPVHALPTIAVDEARRHQPFPLTAVQQAYWLGRSNAFELGNISTQVYLEIALRDVEVSRLQQAWNRLIERHDALRLVVSEDGMQRILPSVPTYEVACDDLSRMSPAEQERHLTALRARMSQQIFTGSTWPLFELRLTRQGEHEYGLHLCVDLLCSDAMSFRLLMRDLDRLYEDPSAALPPLSLSYRDCVCGFEQIRETEQYRKALGYWEQRAGRMPAAPPLPLAKDPSAIPQPRFRRRSHTFAPDDWKRLQRRAADAGVSASVLCLAVFSRVLERWSGTGQFTLNLTLFNRLPLHPEIDALVGDFTSLLLLEVDGSRRSRLSDLARDVQTQLWADMEHRYVDGIEVMRLINQRSTSARAHLMPVVFTSVLGLPGQVDAATGGVFTRGLADLTAKGNAGVTQTSQVWLDNVVSEVNGGLAVIWDALEELFPDGVLDAMFTAYCSLLDGLASGALSIDDTCAPPLPEAQAQIRKAVNDTTAAIPECLLHEPFFEQAARQPSAPAVLQGDVTLTYADLSRRAHAIASMLQRRGARPNELVGIVMHKGWEQVAAALGVSCAGAAYLPIDAGWPAERIALLLDQGQARLVLTQADLDARAWQPAGVEIIPISTRDRDGDVDALVRSAARPDDLAYVIFTSGSTGVPKGVMIDHRGAVNTIVDINRRYAVSAGDRVLAVSALSFDLSVYDLFGVLAAGGAIVLPDRSKDADARHWIELMQRDRVTIWNSVPALAQLIVDELVDRGRVDVNLRLMLMSGDWIPVSLPDRIRACCPRALQVSLGGATEASIWSIAHVIDRVADGWTSIPYGQPLANQRFHVLGPDLSPCPDWVPGELFIGGVGLAKGYWRDEQKTGERFIVHPASGERLYRTGDRGRYWPDGTIEFLGRDDLQVKVHGHRIELGEIEAALTQHESVAAAAATVVGTGAARRIAAYVVPVAAGQWTTYVGDARDLITDASSRALFKLEQRGLRRFAADATIVRLDTVPFDTVSPDRSAALEPERRRSVRMAIRHQTAAERPSDRATAGATTTPIPRRDWEEWLRALAQVPVDGHAIPKRFYPSAGSLYPVQVYLSLAADAVEGISAGSYYYDPVEHRLIRLTSQTVAIGPNGGFAVMLVAAMDAIAPLYGDLSDRFCRLEAGHLVELLASTSAVHGIALEPSHDTMPDLLGPLELSPSHQMLAWCRGARTTSTAAETTRLDLFARQSYRRFVQDAFDVRHLTTLLQSCPEGSPVPYVYVKPDASTNRSGGFYRFEPQYGLVQLADVDTAIMDAVHGEANRSVYRQSAFSLFFFGAPGSDDAIAAGRAGQALMSAAPGLSIGLCPIGELASNAYRARFGLSDSLSLLYCFEGGGISVEQTLTWPVEAPASEADAFDALRTFLRSKLPAHMVPSIFVTLDRLPLNQNGKVDRRSLPAIDVDACQAGTYEPPSTEVEHAIAARWAAALQCERVGIHNSFFELGGNSLSAIRVLNAIRRDYPDDSGGLSLAAFFANPTVTGVAQIVELNRAARRLEENRACLTLVGADIEEGPV